MLENISRKWLGKVVGLLPITILLCPDHPMVRLKKALDWQVLLEIIERHRKKKLKNAAGRKPASRVTLGAVIVRILESCTLRKASDLLRHYGPARYLCGLEYSPWTPNFRTLSDFEVLLGADGLQEINNYVIAVARSLGFADITGLCSDTTAQEAAMPYPNDVGLMGRFARSIGSAINTMKGKARSIKPAATAQIDKALRLIRKHRLFCKTDQQKQKVERSLLSATRSLARTVSRFVSKATESTVSSLKGHQKTAFARISEMAATFKAIEGEINHYVERRSAVKGKTISWFIDKVRSIVRGKLGKKYEFGLKWGINQIRGGYVSLFRCDGMSEQDCAVKGVDHHIEQFGQAPKEYGYDRGGWSEPHIVKIKKKGVKQIAIAPKGKAKWKVSEQCKKRMTRERAQVEGKIGTLKMYGFNRPYAKTEGGMERSAYRTSVRFNLIKLLKDSGK